MSIDVQRGEEAGDLGRTQVDRMALAMEEM
jgi:hypothetical protein